MSLGVERHLYRGTGCACLGWHASAVPQVQAGPRLIAPCGHPGTGLFAPHFKLWAVRVAHLSSILLIGPGMQAVLGPQDQKWSWAQRGWATLRGSFCP